MNPLPLPAHIHYELLLQLLEQKSMPVLQEMTLDASLSARLKNSREYLHSTVVMLRKALVLQKQLEEMCEAQGIPISYHWALNETEDWGG